MITAEEARKIAKVDVVEQELKIATDAIKESAIKGSRCVHLYNKFWVYEAYSNTKEYMLARKKLEDLGFKVDFYYQEHSIAVDMYTIIKW